ncbi:MAG: hypothetical protein A2804_00585 [Candidatus Pacebacteria bacterium RIFCSPHIGHO2_01_FULL_46_10]|nr:MAG: hypothetical protein A2804_00585 [Candidatus Pacebacteria bacterium RIFCSPHIGHO2_01_FULL_46_10]
MDIKLDQILFQMVNFGVVFGAIVFLVYKPVIKVLDERAKKIHDADRAAEESLKEKDAIDELKKKEKVRAEKESAKMMEKAREQATELKKELTEKARVEIKLDKEKAVKSWELEKKGEHAAMRKEFVDAVYAVTEKVVGKAVDKKAHASLIDKGLKELAQAM